MKICSLSWPIPRSQRISWLKENFSEFESYLKFFYCGHSNLSGHLNSLMLYTSNQPLTFFFQDNCLIQWGRMLDFVNVKYYSSDWVNLLQVFIQHQHNFWWLFMCLSHCGCFNLLVIDWNIRKPHYFYEKFWEVNFAKLVKLMCKLVGV